jgi:hypothetical protein
MCPHDIAMRSEACAPVAHLGLPAMASPLAPRHCIDHWTLTGGEGAPRMRGLQSKKGGQPARKEVLA